MNCNYSNFLNNFMLMMLLSTSALLVNSQLNTNGGVNCTQAFPTEGNSLYYHSEVFAATAKPKDVEAFKYYCTNDLIFSKLEEIDLEYSKPSTANDSLSQLPKLQNTTTTCKRYAEIKAYQYMLHKFLGTQNNESISNHTITSIMYLLQNAGESLQVIQFYNRKRYCPDFVEQQEKVYKILVENDDDNNIEKVLAHLKYRKHWRKLANYPKEFKVSECIDYDKEKCQLYTSLYKLSIASDN